MNEPRPATGDEGAASTQAAVLQARAMRLARARESAAAAAAAPLALCFRLGREQYAIELRWLCRVARLTVLAPVPRTPAHLLGMTSLQGRLLPVYDLRALFGVDARGLSDMTRLLVLGHAGVPDIGVLADEVDGEMRLDEAPAAAAELPLTDPCLVRVLPPTILLIDGQRLLADKRLHVKD